MITLHLYSHTLSTTSFRYDFFIVFNVLCFVVYESLHIAVESYFAPSPTLLSEACVIACESDCTCHSIEMARECCDFLPCRNVGIVQRKIFISISKLDTC